MKKIFIIAASLFALISCQSLIEEFQPVFTGEYTHPEIAVDDALAANKTIADVAKAYKANGSKPFEVKEKFVISGIVSTTDQPGNFYKSFFIQDETGGIEIKIGKNGLYNDYLPGQRVSVDCKGLTIGSYGTKNGMGMVQIGYADPSGAYETSYMEVPLLIDLHVKKGAVEGLVEPVVLSESDLPGSNDTQDTNNNIGKLVTVQALTYGGVKDSYGEISNAFVLLYIDSNKDKKASSNRIFVTGTETGITTWAMSKEKMTEYLASGIWDGINIGNGNDYNYGTVADLKDADGKYAIEKNAYSVSQYFHTQGGKEIQLRTSGFCKFADLEIPEEVLDGKKQVSITGILNLYQGSIQMVVNNIDDIKVY